MSRTKELVEQMIEEYNSDKCLYETLYGIVETEKCDVS